MIQWVLFIPKLHAWMHRFYCMYTCMFMTCCGFTMCRWWNDCSLLEHFRSKLANWRMLQKSYVVTGQGRKKNLLMTVFICSVVAYIPFMKLIYHWHLLSLSCCSRSFCVLTSVVPWHCTGPYIAAMHWFSTKMTAVSSEIFVFSDWQDVIICILLAGGKVLIEQKLLNQNLCTVLGKCS